MRLVVLALVLSIVGAGAAAARCTDDLNELRARVEREQKRQPTAQTAAAYKELQKTDLNIKQMDEVDCYNAVARIRRALTTPVAMDPKAQK